MNYYVFILLLSLLLILLLSFFNYSAISPDCTEVSIISIRDREEFVICSIEMKLDDTDCDDEGDGDGYEERSSAQFSEAALGRVVSSYTALRVLLHSLCTG